MNFNENIIVIELIVKKVLACWLLEFYNILGQGESFSWYFTSLGLDKLSSCWHRAVKITTNSPCCLRRWSRIVRPDSNKQPVMVIIMSWPWLTSSGLTIPIWESHLSHSQADKDPKLISQLDSFWLIMGTRNLPARGFQSKDRILYANNQLTFMQFGFKFKCFIHFWYLHAYC